MVLKAFCSLFISERRLKCGLCCFRYWLHHAAFSIGKHFNTTEELPPLGHPIYKWPSDLLVPDVLFFINATKTPYALGFNQPYTDFTDRLSTNY